MGNTLHGFINLQNCLELPEIKVLHVMVSPYHKFLANVHVCMAKSTRNVRDGKLKASLSVKVLMKNQKTTYKLLERRNDYGFGVGRGFASGCGRGSH
jgi:hypothetical protein